MRRRHVVSRIYEDHIAYNEYLRVWLAAGTYRAIGVLVEVDSSQQLRLTRFCGVLEPIVDVTRGSRDLPGFRRGWFAVRFNLLAGSSHEVGSKRRIVELAAEFPLINFPGDNVLRRHHERAG